MPVDYTTYAKPSYVGVFSVTNQPKVGFSEKACTSHPSFCRIDRVIFNNPATIVFWIDTNGFDHKTVVKCCENDTFDPEKGLAMALCKIMLGDDFHKTFKDWVEIDGNK